MRKIILASVLALTLTAPAHAWYRDYGGDVIEDGNSSFGNPSYTTVPYGNPYSDQQGTGFTTYDGSYTHSCTTMRLGLGWTTVCR